VEDEADANYMMIYIEEGGEPNNLLLLGYSENVVLSLFRPLMNTHCQVASSKEREMDLGHWNNNPFNEN
jgi:hypothetical protein